MIRLVAASLALGLVCAASGKVVINEISYHPPDDDDSLEFIELYNTGPNAADLTGWKFTRGIDYEFPNGTKLPGHAFLVLAHDAEAFKKVYGLEAVGVFKNALKNTGENLE